MRSGAAQLEKERASLRVAETEVKKRDEALHKWSRELHEEAERLRLKEIDQERDFQNRLTALSIYAEESQQGGVRLDELVGGSSGTPLAAAAVEDPKVKEDADMAARLQQELWQDSSYLDADFAKQLQEEEASGLDLSKTLERWQQQQQDAELAQLLARQVSQEDQSGPED